MLVGCGGSCPRPEGATEEARETASRDPEPHEEAEPEHAEEEKKAEPEEESTARAEPAKGPESKAEEKPDPQFPEHASVSQAIAAIPRGAERANIDAETLSIPLQEESLYAPCNLGTQHFKIKVAVWDGRAVGVDVVTANKKLAECLDRQVRSVVWRDKVKSLNTVEYSL